MMVMSPKNISVGRIAGNVTCQNCCHELAPSSDDASYSDGFTACIAARKTMTRKPHHDHVLTTATDASAVLPLPRKFTPSSFPMPCSGESRLCQMLALTTLATMYGMK